MNLSYRLSPAIMSAMLSSFWDSSVRWRIWYCLFAVYGMYFIPKAYFVYYILIATAVWIILFPLLVERRLFHKISEEWGEISLSLREEGLEISHAGARTLYFWPYIQNIRAMRAIENKENFAQNEVVPIPFSAFANDAERQAFVDAVNAGIGKAVDGAIQSGGNGRTVLERELLMGGGC